MRNWKNMERDDHRVQDANINLFPISIVKYLRNIATRNLMGSFLDKWRDYS